MIGKDDSNNEEQQVLKVNDRRKFNIDGSLREGVTLEAEKPKEEMPIVGTVETIENTSVAEELGATEMLDEISAEEESLEELPGADDPASFVNSLSQLVTNAAAALGAMPHPATGKRTFDLETGKYWLDVLAMLKEKTVGNLHPQEAQLLDGILGDLRMQYVQLVRATEEKLKQQAAQKFSTNDILGKR